MYELIFLPQIISVAQHNFQVNLGGILDILANHLYSEESVFLRELIQNATDAITARLKQESNFKPAIEIELINQQDGPSQLIVSENGIGLTESDVHNFLSIIGASSKKEELLKKREDFIGQFGIGLLSCFVVADEIVLITKAAKAPQAIKWIGKTDGTYTITLLDGEFSIGTRVFLTAKPTNERFFKIGKLKELTKRYADFLPYPIHLINNGRKPVIINQSVFPWEKTFATESEKKAQLLAFANEYFEERFIDCVPLSASASLTEGYAFISMRSYSFNTEQQHAVYLHRIFLSDKAANVLPEWVFFAKCIINSKGLRPTASRETFYEDETLATTRDQLGNCITQYLENLTVSNPSLLTTIINSHETAMKLAATSNDDFFNCIYRFISFETNYGTVPLGQLLDQQHPIKYVTDIDEFRKIAGVAFNQSFQLVNAGYVYEAAFFDKLNELYPQYNTTHFDSEELMLELTEISLDERDQIFDFLHHANLVLQDYKCHADVRKFQPVTMPAIYFKNDEMNYLRNIEKSREVADDIWGGILDNMTSSIANNAAATLCFNFNNPVVLKLTKLANKDVTTVLIKVLYVQTLLMGRHALQSKELSVLTNGLGYLIENIVDNNG